MNQRDQYTLELLSMMKNGSLKKFVEEFKELNIWFLEIFQSLHESKSGVKFYQSELEGKYIRFGFANQSLIELCSGSNYQIRNKQFKTIDLHSIYSICRMQIESFIMIIYLFYDSISAEEKEFRYLVYKLHGLIKQGNFSVRFKKHIQIKNEILREIELLKDELSKPKYDKFNNLVKNPLRPRRAKYISTEDSFAMAKLDKGRVNEYWGVLSNHLHSEHISDRQFNFYQQNSKIFEDQIALSTEVCMILTSRLILELRKEFKGVEIYYNTIPFRTQVNIETWADIGDKL